MDQRNSITVCVKIEIKCAKTFEMLTVALSRTQVQLWYNRFKEDREDVNDDFMSINHQILLILTIQNANGLGSPTTVHLRDNNS